MKGLARRVQGGLSRPCTPEGRAMLGDSTPGMDPFPYDLEPGAPGVPVEPEGGWEGDGYLAA